MVAKSPTQGIVEAETAIVGWEEMEPNNTYQGYQQYLTSLPTLPIKATNNTCRGFNNTYQGYQQYLSRLPTIPIKATNNTYQG